jgi:outer membrane protein assembly factor BamB
MSEHARRYLGNYQVLQLLGRGGFADVYLGRHIHLETQAAIKVLHAQLINEEIEHFRQEARTVARLEHPNIVHILDFGVQNGIPFLVMNYAPNGTLRQRHPRGSRVPLPVVVAYVQQVASALQYAHNRHVIHRDIKPDNLLIGANQQILLSDFGIARIAPDTHSLHTHELAGTIAYMAPEQIDGHPGPASDQYALAVLIYEWLSGVRPFDGGSFTELAFKHSVKPVPPLREKVPELSPIVEAVILTALKKGPHQRFASIQDFACALEQASQQEQDPQVVGPGLTSLPDEPAFPLASPHPPPVSAEVAILPGQMAPLSEGNLTPIPPDLSAVAPLSVSIPIAPARKDAIFAQSSSLSAQSILSRRVVVSGLVGLAAAVSTGVGFIWLNNARATSSSFVSPTVKAVSSPHNSKPNPAINSSITSSGSMFGSDLQHTHFVSNEKLLSPTTVAWLALYWDASTGGGISSSPSVANSVIYTGSSDGMLYAFNATTGSTLWKFSTGRQINSSPAVTRTAVYFGSQDSKIYAVDIQGRQLWSVLTGDMIDSSPTVANGIVYIGSNDYNLYALDATSGKILWTRNTRYFIRSSPAVSNRIVYIGSPDTQLYALDVITGSLLWSVSTGDFINSSPAVANGIVYIGSNDSKLYAFDAVTGAPLWMASTSDAIYSSPAIAYHAVYVGSDDGKLYAFNATTGKLIWQVATGQSIRSSPIVANNVVYIGSDDGKFYAFNAANGTLLWSVAIGKQLRSSPTVSNGVVYIGSDDGKLYAFHLPA